MSGVSKWLDDPLVESAVNHLKKVGKDELLGRKLQAIIAAKKHGISQKWQKSMVYWEQR